MEIIRLDEHDGKPIAVIRQGASFLTVGVIGSRLSGSSVRVRPSLKGVAMRILGLSHAPYSSEELSAITAMCVKSMKMAMDNAGKS